MKGCNNDSTQFSNRRRWFHHFMMYGFLLCFGATVTGTIYDYIFGWIAPYDYLSLPVVLGTVGGVMIIIGTTGLTLLFLRETTAMGLLLIVHLGVVAAFFAILPYSKFVHILFRLGSLLKYHNEK